MAEFKSPHAFLILQDEDGVWGQFVAGSLVTDDPAIIKRLESAEGVERVDAPARKQAAKK
jgi:hypothetical protein